MLLLLLVAAADLARLFHATIAIESAARAGALEAASNPTSYQAGQPCSVATNRVICAVQREAEGSFVADHAGRHRAHVRPDRRAPRRSATRCPVTVTSQFGLITPLLSAFFGGQDLTLTAAASAQIKVRPNVGARAVTDADPDADPDADARRRRRRRRRTRRRPRRRRPTPSPTPTPTPVCFPPTADFQFSPGTGKKKQTDFQFTDLSTTTPECPLTWSWNFGDGAGASSTSTLQNPTHMYQSQGTSTRSPSWSRTSAGTTRGPAP